MNKNPLSFSDVEQLLTEMAQHDRLAAARDEAQTQLMCAAARGEIRRVFFRRRCRRVAGSAASVAALGGALAFLLPDFAEPQTPAPALAVDTGAKNKKYTFSPAPAPAMVEEAVFQSCSGPVREAPTISYSATLGGQDHACDVVIYSVPL